MISPNFSQLGLRPRRLRIKRYHARFRAIMVNYSTVTSFYLIREREHAKYASVLHSRMPFYTLASRLQHTSYYKYKHFSRIINPLFDVPYSIIRAGILLIAHTMKYSSKTEEIFNSVLKNKLNKHVTEQSEKLSDLKKLQSRQS